MSTTIIDTILIMINNNPMKISDITKELNNKGFEIDNIGVKIKFEYLLKQKLIEKEVNSEGLVVYQTK
jgi:repressor of nif and glnA expression